MPISVFTMRRFGRSRWSDFGVHDAPISATIDKTELAMILGGFDPSSAKRQSAWSPKRVA
jgi:hypothetical protein